MNDRIPVVWLGGRELCWDQQLLSSLLDGPGWLHLPRVADEAPRSWTVGGKPFGCVLVVPARYWTPPEIQEWVDVFPWCVLVLTSDEESTFDHRALELDPARHRLWIMTPRPGQHEPGPRYLGEGCPRDTSEILLASTQSREIGREYEATFVGQVTHERREALRAAMLEISKAGVRQVTISTPGFTQGLSRDEYLATMLRSQVAPCPSGPATPDSFRLYEALEAGCVPIVEDTCAGYDSDQFWNLTYPEGVPFPVVHDWATELGKTVVAALHEWPANATRAQAWWLQRKRRLRDDLERDVIELAGIQAVHPPHGRITVLVPVSPTSRPVRQLEIIETTMASVRDRLPKADVIMMLDGVRAEQEDLRLGYEHLCRELVWRCAHEWRAVPIVHDEHQHQAAMTAAALELVRTPTVLFVEQDTPLEGEIPLEGIAAVVESGQVNLVRLHHESEVLDVHEHMMLDRTPRELYAPGLGWRTEIPVLRTVQWSQRPHIAATGAYRTWLAAYFAREDRTMIEDVMHGVVHNAWREHGLAGWEQFRLAMYAPEGNLRRSYHLDGRGEDPKFPMTFGADQ